MPTTDDVEAQLLAEWPPNQPPPTGPVWRAYVGLVARNLEAQERLDTEGLVVADLRGNPIPHPAILIERNTADALRRYGDQFRPKKR